jgi:cytochrome c5
MAGFVQQKSIDYSCSFNGNTGNEIMNKVLITIVAATLVLAGCSDKQDATSDAMDTTTGMASDVAESAGEMASDAKEGASEMVSDASEAVSEVSDGGATGQKVYKQSCQACHANGVANAPKPGDKAAWAPRIATGMDAMLATAIKGKGAMPPKGTCMGCSDDDLKAAIEYMVSQSK